MKIPEYAATVWVHGTLSETKYTVNYKDGITNLGLNYLH